MELALAIINLINTGVPAAAQLILLIRKKDGSVNVMVVLDEADAKFEDNLKMAQEWLAAHPQGGGNG